MSNFSWHNLGGQVLDGEDIDRMNLSKWRNHLLKFLEAIIPYRKTDSTYNIETLLGHCTN